MKTPREVVFFLYEIAQRLKHGQGNIEQLPVMLQQYASAGDLPILTANHQGYYAIVQNQMLPKLRMTDPKLYKVLQKFCSEHPPLHGDASGSHVSYDMMHYNHDLIALAGTFMECWDAIK